MPEIERADSDRSSLLKRELLLTRLVYGIAVSVAVGLMIFAVRADLVSTERSETAARAEVQAELATIRSQLESNLIANLQLVRGLPGLFALEPNLTQEQFERAVKPLFSGQSRVRNIAAAPDMVITLMYPIAGNEEAIGLDYRTIPEQFETVNRARSLRRLVLAGPVDLVQGGTGFISRIPIFEKTDDGAERFWGIVAAVINADELYGDSGLQDPDLGVEIAIRGKDSAGPEGEVFFGRPEVFENDPLLAKIQFPEGTWVMAAVPRDGWHAQTEGIWLQRGIFLLAGALTVVPLLLLARTRNLLGKAAVKRFDAEDARRKIEQQMLHAQKLESLGIMAGGVAHDFNNILTAIQGYTQLAASLPDGDPRVPEFLAHIDQAGDRAGALCNQLLAYSGKGQFVVEPVDLSNLIRETESLLRVSIPKVVRVELDLADELPAIEADATQLRQVVMNLVTNGIEAHGGNEGVLAIKTGLLRASASLLKQNVAGNECAAGDYVYVRVTDTGCGMEPSTLEKVFDPFFTTKSTGRGLGMAAVLGVIRSHGGAVFCETEKGLGTSFTVAFCPCDRTPETVPARDRESRSAVPSTVLIVDDEPEVRRVMAQSLSHEGHTVLTADDGRRGVEVFEEHLQEISLCIVDMAMPRMGGMDTLRAMRQIRPDVPVILISGFSEDEVVTSRGGVSPNAFLKKPFRPDELTRLVDDVSASSLQYAKEADL